MESQQFKKFKELIHSKFPESLSCVWQGKANDMLIEKYMLFRKDKEPISFVVEHYKRSNGFEIHIQSKEMNMDNILKELE